MALLTLTSGEDHNEPVAVTALAILAWCLLAIPTSLIVGKTLRYLDPYAEGSVMIGESR